MPASGGVFDVYISPDPLPDPFIDDHPAYAMWRVVGSNTCGNGEIDFHETCDIPSDTSHDFCSISCNNFPPEVRPTDLTFEGPIAVGTSLALVGSVTTQFDYEFQHTLDFHWTSDLEPISEIGLVAFHTFTTVGLHTITLTATDPINHYSGSASRTIEVTDALVAHIDQPISGTRATRGANVTLSGTSSAPPSHPISFQWTSDVDGILGTGNPLAHAFVTEGTQELSLTVIDGATGFSATDRASIYVVGPTPFVTRVETHFPNYDVQTPHDFRVCVASGHDRFWAVTHIDVDAFNQFGPVSLASLDFELTVDGDPNPLHGIVTTEGLPGIVSFYGLRPGRYDEGPIGVRLSVGGAPRASAPPGSPRFETTGSAWYFNPGFLCPGEWYVQ